MTPRQVAIVGIADQDRVARALLTGSALLIDEPLAQLQAAVLEIECGQSNGAAIGSFSLAPHSLGHPCLALVRTTNTAAPRAEPFTSVAMAALSLYYRFLPSRRPWLFPHPRRAWVVPGLELSEPDNPIARPLTTFAQRPLQLFTLSGDSSEQLAAKLDELAGKDSSLDKLSADSRATQHPNHRLGLALIAATQEALVSEIERARVGLRSNAIEWKTPAGSYFTNTPLGNGGVAFVYPGVGSPYHRVGADLFGFAPALMDRFDQLTGGQSARYLHENEVYAPGATLKNDVVGLGECAISISAVLTMLFRDVFGVQPRSAFGYSFGEAIMAASLGVWPDPVALTAKLDASTVFRSRLQGPMDAIREHWLLPSTQAINWGSYILRCTPAQVFEALRMEPYVYLSIVNSPEEVVIAGDEGGCLRVVSKLSSPQIRMPLAMTMHCPPSRSEYDELVRIHTLPSKPQSGVALFSVSSYQPVAQHTAMLAHAVADGYTKALDFPRLIRRVYAEGARVFLELGGRRNCSTWIEKTLHGRPHVAIACDSQGLAGDAAILRALARLFAHRVPLKMNHA